MAESSNFFGFVEDIGVNFHVPHDTEFAEVFKKIVSGDGGLGGNAVFGKYVVVRFFLNV